MTPNRALSSDPKTWYLLSNLNVSADGVMAVEVHIPATSAWFSGHFPARPVLPGIAHIAMVMDLLRRAHRQPLALTAVKRLRFKQAIEADETLRVTVQPGQFAADRTTYSFLTSRDGQTVCSGNVTVVDRPGKN
jgi:3-hydroxymyristoyl/3-hydroxydecanoyl-(acyl carrier protein) dehydratase